MSARILEFKRKPSISQTPEERVNNLFDKMEEALSFIRKSKNPPVELLKDINTIRKNLLNDFPQLKNELTDPFTALY